MQIELMYGRDGLTIDLADDIDVTIIRKPEMPLVPDVPTAIADALAHPVEAPPLGVLAGAAQTACILICDFTRPVPNHLFLRPMIETMLANGMAAEAITVLVATGLHRPNLDDELVALINDPWVLATVNVVNHYARNDDDHIDFGFTPKRQVPVKLDRRFVEADLRIATGLVEPHLMAGYSGGRKVVAPGIAHEDTIRTFHSARFMEDPLAVNCNLAGNPLHEEQLAIIEMVGDVYALNTVIDEDRNLSFVNFGEVVASHRQAVDHIRAYAELEMPERFSTIVTTSAGYPLDATYYQTVKGMCAATGLLAQGGDLIVASSCSEGMGSPEFIESQRMLVERGPEEFLGHVTAKALAGIDEWQTEMQLRPMRIGSIHLVTDGLRDEDHEITGVARAPSVEAAVAASVERTGDRRVAIIPEGPYVIPTVA